MCIDFSAGMMTVCAYPMTAIVGGSVDVTILSIVSASNLVDSSRCAWTRSSK
jgi:hypothetical protein